MWYQVLSDIRRAVWSFPFLLLLFCSGVYLTVVLRGIQLSRFFLAFRLLFESLRQKGKGKGDLSHFQALMTSLAGAIGTGNIAGVATAIAVGGLGSLFWMLVMAFFGLVLKYAEALLALKYRQSNQDGEISGGPMYYLRYGARRPWMAAAYAAMGLLACFGTGNLIQANSVADGLESLWGIPPIYTGLGLSLVTGMVLLGGVGRIGRLAERIVPFMAVAYVGFALAIIVLKVDLLPGLIRTILVSAFSGQAAVGGFVGSTIMVALTEGFARSVLSNEAGLGTSSIVSAAAASDHPGRQAMIAMTGVYLSTFLVCMMTGLVIGLTGVLGASDPMTGRVLNGAPLAMNAFGFLAGGRYVVTFGLVLFAFTTIVAWAYYGEKMLEYLLGTPRFAKVYRLAYVLAIVLGSALELSLVWVLADITNAIMAIPNLLGLIALSQVLKSETGSFLRLVGRESVK